MLREPAHTPSAAPLPLPPMDPTLPHHVKLIAREWRAKSRDLADWAMDKMVNRKDVWVQYTTLTPEERLVSKRGYKAVTLPQKRLRGTDMVTLEKLARHFGSFRRHHLIGLHTTSPDNTSKWFSIDIDQHATEGTFIADAARRNLAAAVAWWEALQRRGYDPLLLDSNGIGGYQILVLFAHAAPTADVYALAQAIVDDWDRHSLERRPETYPRQPRLTTSDRVGAALRLPGLHHTHDHVTSVWSGEPWLDKPWLEGSAAIDVMLATIGGPDPPAAEPGEPAAAGSPAPVATNAGPSAFPPRSGRSPTVAIDFDGVLAHYDGWKGPRRIGEPLDGAVEFTRRLATWARVVIFSARLHDNDASARLTAWLDRYGFAFHALSGAKPKAHAYVDDRGVSCRPQEDGPVAFLVAEEEIRRLCGLRPEMEPEAQAQLAQLARLWPSVPAARRRRLLETVRRCSVGDEPLTTRRSHA